MEKHKTIVLLERISGEEDAALNLQLAFSNELKLHRELNQVNDGGIKNINSEKCDGKTFSISKSSWFF